MSDKSDGFASDDPVSTPMRELIALFGEALADVKFPDVDARALGTQAKQLEEKLAEVRRAEAALTEARRKLTEAQELLLQRAQRALAYARVFADGDVTLTARLDAIALPRAKSKAAPTTPADPPKKRGRPRKQPEAGTTLFAAAPDERVATAPHAPM